MRVGLMRGRLASAPVLTVWETAALPAGAALLVLGLDWQTLLGSGLAVQARRRAARSRATHWVHAGGRAESVGLGRVATRRSWPAAQPAYAAAQVLALAHPDGAAACLWRLPDGRCWLGRSRDGQVVAAGDVVLPDATAAQALLAPWWERYAPGQPLPQPQAGRLAEALGLATPLAVQASLAPAARLQVRSSQRQLGLGAVVMVGGLSLAVALWPRTPALPPALPDAPDPAAVAWHAYLARTAHPTQADLALVSRTLVGLPMRLAGWDLQAAACQLDATTTWGCHADYRLGELAADSAGLLDAAPASWRLSWEGVTAARAHFPVAASGRTLSALAWEDTGQRQRDTVSALQRLRAAWQQVQLDPPQPVQVQGWPAPAGAVPRWRQRVRLRGPVQSLAVLPSALDRHIAWGRIQLEVGAPGQPADLRSSRFMTSLEGDMYGTQ